MIAAMGVLVRGLGNQKFDLMQQVAWRVAAAVLCGSFLWARRPTLRTLRTLPAREWKLLALRAVLVYGIHLPLLSLSFLYGKYLNVAAAYCFPFPTVFGALLYREAVNGRKASWVAVSLLGLLVISVAALPSWNLGHVYALLASAAAGLALVMRRSHADGLSSEATTYAMVIVGAVVVVLPVAACGRMGTVPSLTWGVAGFIVLAGVLNVACVHLGNYALAGRVNGLRAGSLLTMQIPAAYALSAVCGETVSLTEVVGALLVLVSVWGVNQKERARGPGLAFVLKGMQPRGV
jgi:drug/metabolite transporter (DMT)-like permease